MSDIESGNGSIALIVPVAPADDSWRVLLGDLAALHVQRQLAGVTILFVGSDTEGVNGVSGIVETLTQFPEEFAAIVSVLELEYDPQHPGNRAKTMNAGAKVAQSAQAMYLWFVHADSRLDTQHINALRRSLQQAPSALHYFNLSFYGHRMMWLNAFGVWLRSHLLMTPFGDQALCLSQAQFAAIGGYPETAVYGEDHLLVWHALQRGIRLRCTGTALLTSARKYEHNGWARTTGLHLYLWAQQAWPEFVILVKQRWLGKNAKKSKSLS